MFVKEKVDESEHVKRAVREDSNEDLSEDDYVGINNESYDDQEELNNSKNKVLNEGVPLPEMSNSQSHI